MRAANTKRAIVRCCSTVSPSIPKNEVGTARRKIVISNTNGSNTQYFTENLLVLIILVVKKYASLKTGANLVFIYNKAIKKLKKWGKSPYPTSI